MLAAPHARSAPSICGGTGWVPLSGTIGVTYVLLMDTFGAGLYLDPCCICALACAGSTWGLASCPDTVTGVCAAEFQRECRLVCVTQSSGMLVTVWTPLCGVSCSLFALPRQLQEQSCSFLFFDPIEKIENTFDRIGASYEGHILKTAPS